MPYINEFSNKISHERIVKNPEIVKKLKEFKIAYDVPTLMENNIINSDFAHKKWALNLEKSTFFGIKI